MLQTVVGVEAFADDLVAVHQNSSDIRVRRCEADAILGELNCTPKEKLIGLSR